MNVMIGIDPHEASHTAVALDGAEDQLSSVKVRATSRHVEQLSQLVRVLRVTHPAKNDSSDCRGPRCSGGLVAQVLTRRVPSRFTACLLDEGVQDRVVDLCDADRCGLKSTGLTEAGTMDVRPNHELRHSGSRRQRGELFHTVCSALVMYFDQQVCRHVQY